MSGSRRVPIDQGIRTMGDIQPSQRSSTTYRLVPSESTEGDTLDLVGFLVSCWKLRWSFAVAVVICLLPGLYWALGSQPRVEFTVVLRPPTSGLGASGDRLLVPTSAMISQCKDIVFPILLARSESGSDRLEFENVLADAWDNKDSSALILGASAPAGRSDLARTFLADAASQLVELQKPVVDRYLLALDAQVTQLTQRIEPIRRALGSASSMPGSVEATQLEIELARTEAQLSERTLQKSLSEPTAELRAVLESPREDLLAWRTRRVLTALVGSAAVAAIAAAAVALVGGVRRRLSEEAMSS